ncbi:hypothetical protein, partial [Hydrogenophaga sp.]|uniref:hypothetical protein n=1 Tax=Hydrogenophaga sp. TaxID=1904254 RepID=UPI003AF9244D
ALAGRLAYIQRRVLEVVAIHNRRSEGLSPEDLVYEKISTEDLVLQMKRVVDEIFMNEWILLEGNTPEFEEKRVIRVCEMQDIEKLPSGPTKNHLTSLRDEDPEFFSVLADLRNSFVHHFPVAETYVLYGVDRPTVNTMHVPRGRLNDMRLIEVWLEDLVKSFNRLLIRTFGAP